ncbi:hypothetical protein MNBD_NITROSPINAE04-1132 [hydrothermal vent metagenome]|uniref:Glycosyltransferase RgtA/B/C/D-like domain-containing protein n=1 Tax=hydrothermal vent metagenome TaxID=652676 RepID=A0A3B1C749_9ZZZZ
MSKTAALSIFAILSAFLIAAIVTASPWPEDQDSVNFILGVDLYDPLFHQPHFPGYPVYIVAGKIASAFLGTPAHALIFVSALSGAFTILLFAVFTRRLYGESAAITCAALMAANPVFFEFSHKIQTEAFGTLLLISAVVALGRLDRASGVRWFISGLIFGLLLGVRLSWWPYAFVYAMVSIRFGRVGGVFSGIIAGALLWLIPQIIVIGPYELYEHSLFFINGHFTQWGGALGSVNGTESRAMAIALRVAEAVGWIGSGVNTTRIPWIGVSAFAIFLAIKNRKTFSGETALFIIATAAYLIWVALGQNVSKIRHFVPLIPAIIFLVAPVAKKKPLLTITAAVFLAATIFIDYTNRPSFAPPTKRLYTWLNEIPDGDAVLYCGEAERFFDLYPAKVTVKSVTLKHNLQSSVDATWPSPRKAFVCDDIPQLDVSEAPLAIFRARAGDPIDRTIKVYTLNSVKKQGM